MVEALLPTAWFTDYWVDYTPIAQANVEEAGPLAAELGDERLSIEAESAALRFVAGRRRRPSGPSGSASGSKRCTIRCGSRSTTSG